VDKKNLSLGIVFIVAALACYFLAAKYAPPPPAPPAVVQQVVAQQQAAAPAAPVLGASPSAQAAFATAASDRKGATITTLENDFIQVRFTDFGGAIRDVALKKYPAENKPGSDPYVLNSVHADPMLAIVDFPGLDRSVRYQLVSQTAAEVVYRAVVVGRMEVTRRYVLSPDAAGRTDPYQLRTETTFRNLGGQAAAPFQVALAIGTVAPTDPTDRGDKLATGFSNGNDQSFVTRSALEASGGMLGMGAHEAKSSITDSGPIVWGAVKNQFFSIILTPDEPASDLVQRRIKLFDGLDDSVLNAYGVDCNADFTVPALPAHGAVTLGANFYAGPNEYHRLSNADAFRAHEDKVMQFGYTHFFSETLLTLMTLVHRFVPNWGVSIVITTLLLRTFMLIFTIPQTRSARRMQKIAPEMKALKEKFKDNPQKQQLATMELFKKHKVNPLGGCIPMLITMPFFFGFYAMLRSAAELRFAPFLWAKDLSHADTVLTFGHGHIPVFGTIELNILPLLFGAVSFMQMRLTPQPTVDSSQAAMMKFTPILMTFIYYTYSCALSVYSTTNGIFMIGQQLLVNRMKDDGDPLHQPGAGGKPVKNVTPKKS
jgi:YidC/Oxa1 family membrane protein insertase